MNDAAPLADEQLYEAWRGGDRRSGEALIDRYLAPMKRFFANKIAAAHDLGDLVATTFERCARNLGNFKGDSSFRTYIYGIARNVLREEFRKHARRQNDVDFDEVSVRDLDPSPSVVLADRREKRLLLDGLRSIPLNHQIILELMYFEQQTMKEIAAILDIPMGTVASRVRRGKNELRAAIGQLLAADPGGSSGGSESGSPAVLESTVEGLDRWARELRDLLAAEREDGEASDA